MKYHPTICVCGAGTMGSGIAQVFAQHEFDVVLFDVNESTLRIARSRIEKYAPSAIRQIKFTPAIDDCKADLIIEAIVENTEAKLGLFKKLVSINGPETIFTTNTSSLPVTELAMKIPVPERFAGLHFFNPAPVMKLVEIITTSYLSNDKIEFLSALVRKAGKSPVVCSDSPGFIVNRVARPYYLESLYVVEKYDAGVTQIDALMEATGFRMGPFRLMDLIGNDVNYSVSCIVHESLGKPGRLRPSPIQERLVKEGALGRKTGKGYYEYPVE